MQNQVIVWNVRTSCPNPLSIVWQMPRAFVSNIRMKGLFVDNSRLQSITPGGKKIHHSRKKKSKQKKVKNSEKPRNECTHPACRVSFSFLLSYIVQDPLLIPEMELCTIAWISLHQLTIKATPTGVRAHRPSSSGQPPFRLFLGAPQGSKKIFRTTTLCNI